MFLLFKGRYAIFFTKTKVSGITFHLIYGLGTFKGVHYSKTADYSSKPNLRVEKKIFKIFKIDFWNLLKISFSDPNISFADF